MCTPTLIIQPISAFFVWFVKCPALLSRLRLNLMKEGGNALKTVKSTTVVRCNQYIIIYHSPLHFILCLHNIYFVILVVLYYLLTCSVPLLSMWCFFFTILLYMKENVIWVLVYFCLKRMCCGGICRDNRLQTQNNYDIAIWHNIPQMG